MNRLNVPIRQTSSVHKMHTSRSQREDASLIEQKLLDMTFDRWMGWQRSILVQLQGIVRTNTSLKGIISHISSLFVTING